MVRPVTGTFQSFMTQPSAAHVSSICFHWGRLRIRRKLGDNELEDLQATHPPGPTLQLQL